MEQKYGQGIMDSVREEKGMDGLVIQRYLGRGSFGSVYSASNRHLNLVLKFEHVSSRDMKQECKMHKLFHQKNIGAPEPLFCKEFHKNLGRIFVTGMKLDRYAEKFGLFNKMLDKLQPPAILDYVLESIDGMLTSMCEHNLIHGDFHWGNIGFQESARESRLSFPVRVEEEKMYVSPLVIDFGYSKEGRCIPEIELLQLIRTLYPQVMPEINRENAEYLFKGIVRLMRSHGGKLTIPFSNPRWTTFEINFVDAMYLDLFDRHIVN